MQSHDALLDLCLLVTELARAGGVYLCVKSVKSAVMQLVKVREVLGEGRTMQEAVIAVEGLGW